MQATPESSQVQFYHDNKHNVLVYPSQNPLVLNHIPDAKLIGREYSAIPRTLTNCQVLRWYNWPVPAIMDGYQWPAPPGFTPYESQILASNFMVLNRRCFNLSDMGSGKTAAALWAADFIMQQYAPGTYRALVVAPLSILRRKWADDVFKLFLSNRTFKILHGTADKRRELLAEPADFYLVNHDGVGVGAHTRGKFELDGFSKDLAGREDIKIAIVDEASAYKDATTKRHRIARLVFGHREYCWLMTGTPTPTAPTDSYGLAKIINNAYGRSFTSFRDSTMHKISQFRYVPKKDGYEQARKLLQPSIRIDIKSVWDAPALTTRQREVELTDQQKKELATLKRELQITLQSGAIIDVVNEAALRTKFIQIALGAVYDGNHKAHAIDASPRLNELKLIIEQAPGKLLIFSPLTSVIELLYKELKEWPRAIINGNISQKERAAVFEAFQRADDSEPRLLIADPGTMAHGLDLWRAQTVVWYGITEKAELYAQANARAHRPGQRYPVSVVQIVATSLEREIFNRLEKNLSLQGTLLDAVRRGEL